MVSNKVILWDVDTQADFMLAGGKLYVPGAETIIPNLQRLVETARSGKVFLVSSADAHTPDDEEFKDWPPHCVQGTPGQKKIPETLAPNCFVAPNTRTDLPKGLPQQYSQVVLEKQKLDVFTNPNTESLLELLGREAEYAVVGVVTEYCVRLAAKGLLERGRRVALVTDAIQTLDPAAGQRTVDELTALGARLVNTEEVLAMI